MKCISYLVYMSAVEIAWRSADQTLLFLTPISTVLVLGSRKRASWQHRCAVDKYYEPWTTEVRLVPVFASILVSVHFKFYDWK